MIYSDKQGHIVLVTKVTQSRVTAIVTENKRKHRVFFKNEFAHKFPLKLERDVEEVKKLWLASPIKMTERVRKELYKMSEETVEVKERAARIDKNLTITVLAEANPKREGSASFDRFELYQDGMTIAEFVEAGGSIADVHNDVAKGYISIG